MNDKITEQEIQNEAFDLGYQACLHDRANLPWDEAEEFQAYRKTGLTPAEVAELAKAQAERDNPQPLSLEQVKERIGKPVWCSVNKLYGVLGKRENDIVVGFSYGWDWLEDLIRCPIYDYEPKEQVK